MKVIQLTPGQQLVVRAIASERQRIADEANRRIAEYASAEEALIDLLTQEDGAWHFALEGTEVVLRQGEIETE